jgi:hypothetical protein
MHFYVSRSKVENMLLSSKEQFTTRLTGYKRIIIPKYLWNQIMLIIT